MQPSNIIIDQTNHRLFSDTDGTRYPSAGVKSYALRRVFALAVNTPKYVDFVDLDGFWRIVSCYISSPEDSEITVEMLDSNNIPFYTDKFLRNEMPKEYPVVLVTPGLRLKLTAARSPIDLVLIYLEPANLLYSKDFI